MMFRNKDQNSLKKQSGGQETLKQPILAAKRRRQLHPFFFRIGPVALSISSVLLIGLMAVLYLSQLGQAVYSESTNSAVSKATNHATTRESGSVVYHCSRRVARLYC